MKGSCLCGDVRYEIDRLDGPIARRTSARTAPAALVARPAAPFTTTARVARADLRWLAGGDRLTAFESSPGKKRYFCPRCGTHIAATWDHEDQFILRVATLDESPHARPVAHIWRSHEVDWLHPRRHQEFRRMAAAKEIATARMPSFIFHRGIDRHD